VAVEQPTTQVWRLIVYSSIAKFAQELCLEDSEDLGLLQINLAEYLYETCKQSDGAIDLLCTARNSAKSDVLKMRATVLLGFSMTKTSMPSKEQWLSLLMRWNVWCRRWMTTSTKSKPTA
jgi:hypothetical protein